MTIFGCHRGVPNHDRVATRRFALGAVFVFRLPLLHRASTGAAVDDLCVALEAFLCAA